MKFFLKSEKNTSADVRTEAGICPSHLWGDLSAEEDLPQMWQKGPGGHKQSLARFLPALRHV